MADYCEYIDWYEELNNNSDKWINHGRNVLEEKCDHKTLDTGKIKDRETNIRYSGYCNECEASESDCEPMMNYGYPLRILPSEDEVFVIIKKTCLTVMENQDNGQIYLVLCGGGMDLSQNIAYGYILANQRIPPALAYEVSTQEGLNYSGKVFETIMLKVRESMLDYSEVYIRKAQEIILKLKEIKKKEIKKGKK